MNPRPVILAQLDCPGTTPTDLYTVPEMRLTSRVTIMVCNRTGAGSSFRVAIRPKGAVLANSQYIYYDLPVTANDAFYADLPFFALQAGDVVTVYAGGAGLSFSLFGEES